MLSFYTAADATGATPTFTATNLPPGLNITSGGQIVGTANADDAADGFYVATITATDGTYRASQDVAWTVAPAVAITDPGPRSNAEGDAVSLQLSATDSTGAAPTFTAANLPPDLTISATGLISGTVAAGTAGVYNVTVTATDGTYSSSDSFSWEVADSAVSMTDPGPQSNAEGDAVSLQMTATDATGLPRQYTESGLPPGLSINANGVVTGTISAARGRRLRRHRYGLRRRFRQRHPDLHMVGGSGRRHHRPQLAEQHRRRRRLTATVGHGRNRRDAGLQTANLPAGLTMGSGGQITGTVAAGAAGFYDVVVTATDGTYSASQDVVWSVAPAVTITELGPKSDTEGEAVSLSITAGDTTGATPTFTESGLPPGLNITSGGQITGTVSADAAPGPYTATITATDGTYSASEKVRWNVAPAPMACGPATSSPSTPTSPTSAGMAGWPSTIRSIR